MSLRCRCHFGSAVMTAASEAVFQGRPGKRDGCGIFWRREAESWGVCGEKFRFPTPGISYMILYICICSSVMKLQISSFCSWSSSQSSVSSSFSSCINRLVGQCPVTRCICQVWVNCRRYPLHIWKHRWHILHAWNAWGFGDGDALPHSFCTDRLDRQTNFLSKMKHYSRTVSMTSAVLICPRDQQGGWTNFVLTLCINYENGMAGFGWIHCFQARQHSAKMVTKHQYLPCSKL